MPKIRSKTRTSQAPERSPASEETAEKAEALSDFSCASFSGHVAIFGEDAVGRNSAATLLIRGLKASQTPFLVIEPSRKAYRQILNRQDHSDQEKTSENNYSSHALPTYEVGEHNAFAVNPLEIMPGVRLDNHVARLTAIFKQLFQLDQSTALILELALELAYERRGWNLVSGRNSRVDESRTYDPELQPTLSDVTEAIDQAAARSSIDKALVAPALAALRSSLDRLLAGNRGCLFGVRTKVSASSLFQNPAILELNSLPGDRERAFLIAVLFCFLEEHAALKPRTTRGDQHSNHVLVLADSQELEPAFFYLERAGDRQTIGSQSLLARRLCSLREAGESVVFTGASADQLRKRGIAKPELTMFTKETNLEELKQLAEWSNLETKCLEPVADLSDSQAIVYSAKQAEPSIIKLESLGLVEASDRNGGAQGEKREEEQDAGAASDRELLVPWISDGAAYAREAFYLDTYLLGKKVSESPVFREVFIRYILSVLIDMTQLVHFRPRIMQEVHAIAGRKHKLPNHLVCWCALSLVVDRYFADKAVEYDWSMADLRKVKDVWYKMMAPAFLPSIPNRKLDAGIIRSWIADFTALHKRENLPMPACGQCTNKCQFRYDVAACLDEEDRHAFKDLLSREEQAEAVAWLGKVICERLAGKFDLNLAYCVATSLVFEQDISKDAQLLFMHNVREHLSKEAGSQTQAAPRR